MKNNLNYIIFFLGLTFFKATAQNPEIKTDLPTVIPPSPTVAALMKFEEVPVSNYTGVPDISIPLFNSATLSKNVNLDIALKYHSGVGVDDRSSDVGLGWSLFAGGSISRTVRDLPDELLQNGSSPTDLKVGLYHTNNGPILTNNYYYVSQNILNATQDFYKPFNIMTPQEKNIGNEFLWESAFTEKYDTEHDLWQFNFMGNSGRFYIKKNTTTNLLEIIPLDDYRIKIIYNYQTTGTNLFAPISFTIYDERGMKYVFDVYETSENKYGSQSKYAIRNESVIYIHPESLSADKIFISAIHLSKIFDSNNNLIVEFNYSNQNYIESFSNSTITKTDQDHTQQADFNNCQSFPPLESISVSTTKVNVKKIDNIDVKGNSRIYFEYVKGRLDNNINLNQETAFLKSLILRDNNLNFVKKYSFEYEYSNVISNRMILQNIKELDNNGVELNKSIFKYKNNDFDNYSYVPGKDYWGYFNLIKKCEQEHSKQRKATPEFCTTDVLERITHATGGSTLFEFESNTYSYIGSEAVTNFNEYDQNFEISNTDHLSFNTTTAIIPINISNYPLIIFKPSNNIIDIENNPPTISLWKKINNEWVSQIGLNCYNQEDCCISFHPEQNAEYGIKYTILDITNSVVPNSLTIEKYQSNGNQFLYGGGSRVKSIKYFSENIPQSVTDYSVYTPIKQKKFKYNFFNNQAKSSGSLAFPEPLVSYPSFFLNNSAFAPYSHIYCDNNSLQFGHNTFTSGNHLISLKTSGSDVGYKEVTVFEEGLGQSEFQYYSPIDFPEENVPAGPPFIPTKNIDYKRGLLINEKVYNQNQRILNENIFDYDFMNFEEYVGVRFRKPDGECYTGSLFTNYSAYVTTLNIPIPHCIQCKPNYYMSPFVLCGLPLDMDTPKIIPVPIIQAYGWAKLTSKTTKNYFYPTGSNTPNIVQSTETFDYNPINKQIAEHTVTNSLNETLKTKYFYHTGNSIHSQNRIAEIERIETYRGADLISTNKINYSNVFAGNVSFLPQSISTSKGTNTLESRVKYNSYNQYGNPLEVQQENGTVISYIYGYNQTLPVAKLENIAYGSIPTNLITAIQSATNTGTEASVITALNSLRTNANLVNAMITTFTYKPLIGVSTITDPKGDTITYEYDSFGRLSTVKDKNGNILSENQYNYRTQN